MDSFENPGNRKIQEGSQVFFNHFLLEIVYALSKLCFTVNQHFIFRNQSEYSKAGEKKLDTASGSSRTGMWPKNMGWFHRNTSGDEVAFLTISYRLTFKLKYFFIPGEQRKDSTLFSR